MKKKLLFIIVAILAVVIVICLRLIPGTMGTSNPGTTPKDGDYPRTEFRPGGDWSLMLVNEDYPAGDYEPELEEVQEYFKMDVRVADTMRRMISDAKAQGVDLKVCSAYRPYESQARNFQDSVNAYQNMGYSEEQAIREAKRLIALPGTSEHQTGLAADIVSPSYQSLNAGFANTKAGKWLRENAPGYGFILRYPADKTEITGFDYEPWHFRYVGVEAATEITGRGICLEEYLGAVEMQDD